MAAYSSVCHINLVLHGLIFFCSILNTRIYLVSLSHGYISRMLFYMFGSMSQLSGTRLIFYNCGLFMISGFLVFFYGLVMLSNFGVPPQLSFWGEIIVMIGLLNIELAFLFFIFIFFIFSIYYSVFFLIRFMVITSFSYCDIRRVFFLFLGLLPIIFVMLFLILINQP